MPFTSHPLQQPKNIAILVGGSDLFLGARGISAGTRKIIANISDVYDEIIPVNFNYFLDRGRSLKRLGHHLSNADGSSNVVLYGYSQGGNVVLQLARELPFTIPLLITVDIANGPWSHRIDRTVPSNVKRNINVFQRRPNFPLRSYGLPAHSDDRVEIENIELTGKRIGRKTVSHTNIELLMVDRVSQWLIEGAGNIL